MTAPSDKHDARTVLEVLVGLKKIKRKIEDGTATQTEETLYKMTKEGAWEAAESVLASPVSSTAPMSGHEGGEITRERIVQGHSFFPPSAAFPQGYATGHRPYSQGWTDASGKSTEACYICTCLAEIDRLERELSTHSATAEKGLLPGLNEALAYFVGTRGAQEVYDNIKRRRDEISASDETTKP